MIATTIGDVPHYLKHDENALMIVLPADHVIDDQIAFAQAVETAKIVAQEDFLVTFGVVPSAPETGYGYIKAGATLSFATPIALTAYQVQSFSEKPDRETATAYLQEGGYTWNSGMFVFTAKNYLQELQRHRPDIQSALTAWAA